MSMTTMLCAIDTGRGMLALQAELQQLRTLLQSSIDVICAFDEEGRFTYASAASLPVWGYEPEELIGSRYIDLVIPEDRPITNLTAKAIMDGSNVTSFENRNRKKDGSIVPIIWSATWNRAEQMMYCIARDATEKKSLEERFIRNKRMFEAFMSHSPIVGWLTDEEGVMHYMNNLYLQTYGFTEADLGKNIYDMFPEQMAVDYHLNNLRVVKEGKAIKTVEKAILPNGKLQVLKIFKFPLVLDGINMVAGWAVDITEQMELEQELEKTVERYHYVDEATSDAIYDWDLVNNKIYRGNGYQALFGFPEETISIRGSLSLIHPDDVVEYKRVVFGALRDLNTTTWKIEYRHKTADGSYKNVIDKAFIINSATRAIRVIGAIQDITEQKQLQEKLVQQERKNKSEMVKSIIETQEKERRKLSVELHDNVNQMLTSCKLLMEVALDGGAVVPNLIKRSHQSLTDIIREIRQISHDLNPSVLQDIGLVDSISQLVETINMTGKLHMDFIPSGCMEKECLREPDRIAIFRIIQEQTNNIVKHAKATKALLKLTKKGTRVSIFMEDNGVGFDCNKIKKGLGFRNIKNRIDYYDGTFELQTAPGKGTKMCVELTVALDGNETNDKLSK